MVFSRAVNGVFCGRGNGVFGCRQWGFCGRGIGVFGCRHWCFCGRGIGVFVCREIGVCRAQCAGATVFFWEKTCEPRIKTEKRYTWTRWTSKRALVGDFMRECRSAARLCDGFKPTRCPYARGRPAGRACPRRRAPRARPATDRGRRGRAERERRTEPGVRQRSDAPSVWRRWQPGSDDGAADSTSSTGYYYVYMPAGTSNSSTPRLEEETTSRGDPQVAATCVSTIPQKRRPTDSQVGQAD